MWMAFDDKDPSTVYVNFWQVRLSPEVRHEPRLRTDLVDQWADALGVREKEALVATGSRFLNHRQLFSIPMPPDALPGYAAGAYDDVEKAETVVFLIRPGGEIAHVTRFPWESLKFIPSENAMSPFLVNPDGTLMFPGGQVRFDGSSWLLEEGTPPPKWMQLLMDASHGWPAGQDTVQLASIRGRSISYRLQRFTYRAEGGSLFCVPQGHGEAEPEWEVDLGENFSFSQKNLRVLANGQWAAIARDKNFTPTVLIGDLSGKRAEWRASRGLSEKWSFMIQAIIPTPNAGMLVALNHGVLRYTPPDRMEFFDAPTVVNFAFRFGTNWMLFSSPSPFGSQVFRTGEDGALIERIDVPLNHFVEIVAGEGNSMLAILEQTYEFNRALDNYTLVIPPYLRIARISRAMRGEEVLRAVEEAAVVHGEFDRLERVLAGDAASPGEKGRLYRLILRGQKKQGGEPKPTELLLMV